jgi:hypothetical protein
MEVNGQLHAQAALPPAERDPSYPLDRGLGGSQIQSGLGGKEKKSHEDSCRDSNLYRPAHSLVISVCMGLKRMARCVSVGFVSWLRC